MNCKICSNEAHIFTHKKILGKYNAAYYKCPFCGFLQTEAPYWLDESYSEAITGSDLGMLSRNIALSKITGAVIAAFFDRDGKFIDYGSGYGSFVRMMRDAGFDFRWHDKFCENIFARGFEHEDKESGYEMAAAFEVFEHLTDPLDELDKILRLSQSILFTTELLPANAPPPQNWWYYGEEHGQHISFYTVRSLSLIAKKYALNLYTDGRSIHLLTPRKFSPFLFRVISRYRIAAAYHLFSGRKSLIKADFKKITGRDLS